MGVWRDVHQALLHLAVHIVEQWKSNHGANSRAHEFHERRRDILPLRRLCGSLVWLAMRGEVHLKLQAHWN